MSTMFLGIVIFLILLAIFDLFVGVSNDAVNFMSSAVGAKVASFRTIIIIASIGVFAGAAMSNGMMDIARHGIMVPMHFSFYDVITLFLAVMVTDVVLLDIFNTMGLPTSTTVSMVFELLGGTCALALIKIAGGATDAAGVPLSLGDLVNTEKAISVILGIFLSVAIAFILGSLVQWIARLLFSFTYSKERGYNLKIGIFGGISVIAIIWFLLINGLKGSSLMTPELKAVINENTWLILGAGAGVFSIIMTVLSILKINILKCIVLLGTFALAMAFAGNDLVNFVGVPLTGLESFLDYSRNGIGDPHSFTMESLMGSAHTPIIFLVLAGVIMVISLIFSKKAQNVVKTSVDLARQDGGDEMFGSSQVARTIVRSSTKFASSTARLAPLSIRRWVNSRFDSSSARLPEGAAFDQLRASVNLVLAGLLVALGTSMKLPLSTTYVTFMVAMGSSLADRAWGRESAVFRITGVISVIGGWFLTAGIAFVVCALISTLIFYGGLIAIIISIAIAVALLIRSNKKYAEKAKEIKEDDLFTELIHSSDQKRNAQLLYKHIQRYDLQHLAFIAANYKSATDAFFNEEYRQLKRSLSEIDEERKKLKRQRRREIIGIRRIDPLIAVECNTWYFLSNNSIAQMMYCLKRLSEPCVEHLANNFSPVPDEYSGPFIAMRNQTIKLIERSGDWLAKGGSFQEVDLIIKDAKAMQQYLSSYRKTIIDYLQTNRSNIESMTVFLNLVQESQELVRSLRHQLRGIIKFRQALSLEPRTLSTL